MLFLLARFLVLQVRPSTVRYHTWSVSEAADVWFIRVDGAILVWPTDLLYFPSRLPTF